MSALLLAALGYAQAGIPVLPLHTPAGRGRCSCRRLTCDRPGKHPRWHPRLITAGLHHASTDPERIRAWWSVWPNANIGLRTGVVCDVCDIDTATGLSTVLQLLGGQPLNAPTVHTGSGGCHIYLAATGAGNRAGLLPGVDWRGAGGYVVAPPSLHATGQRYRWARPLTAVFPPCPVHLRDLVTAVPAPPAGPPTVVRYPSRYGAAALRAEEFRVRSARVGTRNNTLYHASRSLGRLVAAGILAAGEVTTALTDAALAAGLGRAETARTIRSGLTAAHRRRSY